MEDIKESKESFEIWVKDIVVNISEYNIAVNILIQ